MKYLLAGIAAVSLVAAPSLAQPSNANGKSQGDNKPAAAQGNSGKAKSNSNQGQMRGPSNGNGQGAAAQPTDKGPGPQAANRTNGPSPNVRPQRANNGIGNGNDAKPPKAVRKAPAMGNGNRSDTRRWERSTNDRFTPDRRDYGLVEGCPPGLAKKRNGCTPPGLARKQRDSRYLSYRPDYFGFGSYGDGRYLYGDGFLYRLGAGDRITSYIPLLGGALSVGTIWPDYYRTPNVPSYYSDYYGLGPTGNYGYANDVLYRVDPETAAITSIAALLTGDDFSVGQPMPAGYDVYNVPYAYRDRYYDRPDAMYRYSDGYVYQVDPETRLIAAAIELVL